ncbi:putative zinc finger BED domain-containing protein 1-like [Triplophysa rosa]|uniref:Zinc finger BED domain-containing protein 1-like n=1 Tax=Triplophysa rosa TaxID=992332 RepID=A0A9W7TSK2_TRIRA|nr:putative zinc finger BED domain-containing protein 1-like [Triplophysa rosa]
MAKHTTDAETSPPPRQSQTTLDCFQRRRMDNSTSNRLTTSITKWVAKACRPVNVVDDEGLLEIIHIASNDYTGFNSIQFNFIYIALFTIATVTSKIHDSYEKEKAKVEEALRQTNTVALTGDYWTSLSNHSYLGVTAHYFDTHWKLRSHALTVMKTDERHYANVCAEHFLQVARQWNIELKISSLTTDSARNMIAAARQLPFEHMPCIAHSLHRAITVSLQNSPFDSALAKCRKVVGHFKHSPANAAELEQQQVTHHQKKESLTQEVSTRWNSTLEMIKRIQRNKEPLRETLTLHASNINMPTAAELDKLKRLETVLEHCRYVSQLLGGEENFVTCSVVLPALCHLPRVMEVSEDDPAYMIKFKETFTTDMDKRKEKTNITWLRVASALDPRFKDLKCLSRADRAEVWSSICALLQERGEGLAQQNKPVTTEPPKKMSRLMSVPDSSSDDEEDCIEKCVERYKAEPSIGIEDCPLQWWSKHEGGHSEMANLARRYLTVFMSGHVVQKKRAALSSENVNRLVCLSNWLSGKKGK